MSIRRCELVQEQRFLTEEQIEAAINGRNSINKVAYILHDKDTYTEEDAKKNPEHQAGTLKPAHWHVVMQFKEGQQQQIKYVAKWFGQEPQYVQKIKSSHIEDAYAYLIHQNAPGKYQYDPSEVKANFDYEIFIKENCMFLDRCDEIIAQIGSGLITRTNWCQFVDIHEYVKYERSMMKAFDYYDKKMNTVNRELEAIFITGQSGTGKTSLAKYIAEGKGMSCFISSVGQDMLDGYENEEVVVYNDIRGNCGLALNEFIQMVDNNTNARGKSRFRNKNMSNCKLVIVTTVLSMGQLLKQLDPDHHEDWKQFRRRFKMNMTVYPDHIMVSQYDPKTDKYGNSVKLDNPIKDLIQKNANTAIMTAEELSKHLNIPMLPTTPSQIAPSSAPADEGHNSDSFIPF